VYDLGLPTAGYEDGSQIRIFCGVDAGATFRLQHNVGNLRLPKTYTLGTGHGNVAVLEKRRGFWTVIDVEDW
jgi:hypothetical protein